MESDALIILAVVLLAWLVPTFVLAGEPEGARFTIAGQAEAPALMRLGRPLAGRLTRRRGWQSTALARAITGRLEAAGQGEYTAADYAATEIGVALVAGAMVLSTTYLVGTPAPPFWGVIGALVAVVLRWWRLGRKAKERQLMCRLQAPRFADEFRIKVKASAGRTIDILRDVARSSPPLPFNQEIAKAVKIAESDPYITLEQALDAAAVRMASPSIRVFFKLLGEASKVGAGRLEACTRFSVQMRQEIEYQAKRRSDKLVFMAIASLVLFGMPAALLLMMEVPLLDSFSSLRGLVG